MSIGNNIRNLRIVKNMTVTDMAKELDISVAQMSKMETGKAKIQVSNLPKIAKVLGVTINALFYDYNSTDNDSKELK